MNMIDIIKKAVLTGIGVASLTKEKVEELSKELVDKGKLSEQEGEKFVQDMINRAEESRSAWKDQTDQLVKNALDKMQLARAEDIAMLRSEIEKLREEITALRSQEKQEP
jgi:polyhydroxyalkanoate synthesis regulator phasin